MSSSSAGLPASQPIPLRSLTSFVGRQLETAEINALLRRQDVRLLTLTGTGGVGKTRLAVRVVGELIPDFADMWFVSLDTISDPNLVGPAIAHALGLRNSSDRSPWESSPIIAARRRRSWCSTMPSR
jgi:predicted ATPase